MSEVMRWRLKGFLPGVEGMCSAVMRPEVVLSLHYDAAQVELIALREDLAELRQQHAEQSCVFCNNSGELLTRVKTLQSSLTASAQRNSTLIASIVALPDEFKGLSGCENTAGVYACIDYISDWVAELAKPTESGASE